LANATEGPKSINYLGLTEIVEKVKSLTDDGKVNASVADLLYEWGFSLYNRFEHLMRPYLKEEQPEELKMAKLELVGEVNSFRRLAEELDPSESYKD